LPQPANFLNGAPIRLVAVSHTGMPARPVDPLCRAQNGEASLALPRMGARQKIDAKQEIVINFFMVPPAAKLWNAGILPGIPATGFTRSGEQDTSFGRRQAFTVGRCNGWEPARSAARKENAKRMDNKHHADRLIHHSYHLYQDRIPSAEKT
jgi:hypothetical protein